MILTEAEKKKKNTERLRELLRTDGLTDEQMNASRKLLPRNCSWGERKRKRGCRVH